MEQFKKKTDQAAHSQQEVQMRRLECAAKFWIAQTRKLMMAFWISVTLAYSGILYSGELRGLDPQALAAHRAAARRFSAPIADQTAEVGRMFQGTECRNNGLVSGIRDLMSKCLPAYDLI